MSGFDARPGPSGVDPIGSKNLGSDISSRTPINGSYSFTGWPPSMPCLRTAAKRAAISDAIRPPRTGLASWLAISNRAIRLAWLRLESACDTIIAGSNSNTSVSVQNAAAGYPLGRYHINVRNVYTTKPTSLSIGDFERAHRGFFPDTGLASYGQLYEIALVAAPP